MSQIRMTKQRTIILDVLRSVSSHPTADELYGLVRKKLPRISLGTVYRNLEHLSSTGTVLKLERAGLQMRFDGDTRPHQHVRCKLCGAVGDIHPAIELPDLPHDSNEEFLIHKAEIEFLGICKKCAQIQ